MMHSTRIKHFFGFFLIGLFSLMLSSCPDFLGSSVDIKTKIEDDVALATAAEWKVNIASSSYGIVTPSGSLTAKEGIPFTVNVVPFASHGLIGWHKVSGPGNVRFEDLTTNSIQVTVTGGDVAIEAVLLERPSILYTTPIGNNIAKNTPVAVIFSRVIDFASVNDGTIKILQNGNQPIAGSFELLSDGKTIRFLPDATLSSYTNYVVSVSTEVQSTVDQDDPDYNDVSFTNSELNLTSVYTAAFRTGNELDVTPPTGGAFSVADVSGDNTYSGGLVNLDGISATDDAGIAFYKVMNTGDQDYLVFDINDQPKSWSLGTGVDGSRTIEMLFVDSNGLVSDPAVTRSIYLDTTPPTGSIVINSDAGAAGFTGSTTASLALLATDPDVDTGIKGSGESSDGTDTVNRKEMRFSNTSNINDEPWETYDTARAGWILTTGFDGTRAVYAQFRDSMGNESSVVNSTIYLDQTAPTGDFWISGASLITNTAENNLTLDFGDGSGSGFDQLEIEASSGLASGSAWTSRDSGGASIASGSLSGDGSSAAFTAGATLDLVLDSGSADGSRIINLRAFDKVGNSAVITKTITLDRTPPTGGSILINGSTGGSNQTNSTSVTVNVSAYATDALTGTASMGFSDAFNEEPTIWKPLSSSASYTIPSGDGSKTVWAWFKDAAGNYAATSTVSATITLDTSAPTGTVTLTSNPTQLSTVTINSNISGALKMRFSNNNLSWSSWEDYSTTKAWDLTNTTYGGTTANGTRYVYCQYSDNAANPTAGNITVRTSSTLFDNTIPSASISVNAGDSYTTKSTATLTISGSDNVYSYRSLQIRFSNNNSTWSSWQAYETSISWSLTSATYGGNTTNGSKTVYMQIKDPLGNTRSVNDSIIYDNVAPSAGTVSLKSGDTYTNSATVTVGFSVLPSDATSGVYLIRYSNNAALWSTWETYTTSKSWNITSSLYGGTSNEGYKYVYVQVQDRAGNISSYRYDYIIYDITPPTGYFYMGGSTNPSSLSYPYGWLYFYISDNLSGVAERKMYNGSAWMDWESYSSNKYWYLLPGNGTKYVYAYFKDAAGNTSSLIYDSVSLAATYNTLYRPGIATDRTDMSGDSNAYMSTNSINLSDGYISAGQVYTYYTSSGRYGKMYIVSFNKSETAGSNVLTVNLTTYNANGTVYTSKSNLKIRGTYRCDLDLGLETTTGADFFWRQDTSTTRYLVPTNNAKFYRWN